MRTQHIDDDHAVDDTVACLRAGQLVVVPTDTVYGLAALPTDAGAVERIYRAKARPAHLPLPVLAASLGQVEHLGVEFSAPAALLAARYWPGPLTMVFGFDARAGRPDWLRDRDEVAVRLPDHDFLRRVMERTGVLLVTSANPHGSVTAPVAAEVAGTLGSAVELIVDGGTLDSTPSTLVNVRHGEAAVERTGALPAAAIAAALGLGAPRP
jgi:L-threonylcarbamoyladenylate synthase